MAAGLNPLWCGAEDSPIAISSETIGTAVGNLRSGAMIARLKTLSPAVLCALIAALGGLIGGSTAVHGLKQNRYGPVDPPALIGRDPHATAYADYADEASYGGYESTAANCDDCSERDLGYRWAIMAEVRRPDQCPNDSWGFRRGCLDYTGGV